MTAGQGREATSTGEGGEAGAPVAADDRDNRASEQGRMLNQAIAERYREAAGLLEAQGANAFRVSAYRRAADSLARCERGVAEILESEGIDGLVSLPGIGRSLAAVIEEIVETGRWRTLERLRGEIDPEHLLQGVPGIGPALAAQIHLNLGVDTLEALEVAAHDGRLERLSGFGPRRAAMVRDALTRMLGRVRPRATAAAPSEPPVRLLLDVDSEYRRKAEADALPRIAPRRFNPTHESWLPILHAERGEWRFTALFSNTARAHELGRTRDWVVIYFHTDHDPEGQRTIVTESRGAMAGRRVVRGREIECRDLPETLKDRE